MQSNTSTTRQERATMPSIRVLWETACPLAAIGGWLNMPLLKQNCEGTLWWLLQCSSDLQRVEST